MKQILLIDDDEKLGQLLTQYLERYDMTVTAALTPSKGFEYLKRNKPDLLILDVMLPEKDGFEICREIRAKSAIYGQLPILMLTAHGEVTDRIVGLELGADDYLPKPFEPRELVARITNILRRSSDEARSQQDVPKIQGLDVDPGIRATYSFHAVTQQDVYPRRADESTQGHRCGTVLTGGRHTSQSSSPQAKRHLKDSAFYQNRLGTGLHICW
jgi:DNA-binding response OmpR family regulator